MKDLLHVRERLERISFFKYFELSRPSDKQFKDNSEIGNEDIFNT
jgi:hypothetical protein